MPSKKGLRTGFGTVIVAVLLVMAHGYVTTSEGAFQSSVSGGEVLDRSEQVAPPQTGITVVATDSNMWLGEGRQDPRARSELVAFDRDGSILYYDDAHDRYWDVDPVPGTTATVEYAYSVHLHGSACDESNATDHAVDQQVWERYAAAHGETDACTRNGVERMNLTTGESTSVFSRVTPGKGNTRYHDADRVNETHLAVADIFLDRVFVVNVSSDRIAWTWNVSDEYPTDSGGPYPDDWTHINDVDVLSDGRLMVSIRNHDQVVFLDRGSGLIEDWTLGADDDHDILYEQHNPDYIPRERGGPAVLVADSENNRILEYERSDGSWERSWRWLDSRLQWPRDADRLPNGHTLITDSNGDRVIEVDRSGEIVWQVDVAFPYEAERFETGDESAGGTSATRAGLNESMPDNHALLHLKQLLPRKYLNALMYTTPIWIGVLEAVVLVTGLATVVIWILIESLWLIAPRARRVTVSK